MTINIVPNPNTDEPQNLGTQSTPWDSAHADNLHTQYIRLHSFDEPLIGLPQGVIDLQNQYEGAQYTSPEGLSEWANILHMRQSGLFVGSARVVMSAEVDVVNSKLDAFFGRNDYVHLGLSSHYPHLEDGWDSLVEIIARIRGLHALVTSLPALEQRVSALESLGVGQGGSGATALNGLTDVTITSPSLSDGQVLRRSGSTWTNSALDYTDLVNAPTYLTQDEADTLYSDINHHHGNHYATAASLTALQETVDGISTFSGDYDDLINKPTLSSGVVSAGTVSNINVADGSGGFTATNWDISTASTLQHTMTMAGHILPSANATYDLGSAEAKVRHLFLSDNSLHIGDGKVSYTSNGENTGDIVGSYTQSYNVTALPPSILDEGDEILDLQNHFKNVYETDADGFEVASRTKGRTYTLHPDDLAYWKNDSTNTTNSFYDHGDQTITVVVTSVLNEKDEISAPDNDGLSVSYNPTLKKYNLSIDSGTYAPAGDYATAASLTDVSNTVNSRLNITGTGTGLTLSSGTLSADMSGFATTDDLEGKADDFTLSDPLFMTQSDVLKLNFDTDTLETVGDPNYTFQNLKVKYAAPLTVESNHLTVDTSGFLTSSDLPDTSGFLTSNDLPDVTLSSLNVASLGSNFTINSGVLNVTGFASTSDLSAKQDAIQDSADVRVNQSTDTLYLPWLSTLNPYNLYVNYDIENFGEEHNAAIVGSNSIDYGRGTGIDDGILIEGRYGLGNLHISTFYEEAYIQTDSIGGEPSHSQYVVPLYESNLSPNLRMPSMPHTSMYFVDVADLATELTQAQANSGSSPYVALVDAFIDIMENKFGWQPVSPTEYWNSATRQLANIFAPHGTKAGLSTIHHALPISIAKSPNAGQYLPQLHMAPDGIVGNTIRVRTKDSYGPVDYEGKAASGLGNTFIWRIPAETSASSYREHSDYVYAIGPILRGLADSGKQASALYHGITSGEKKAHITPLLPNTGLDYSTKNTSIGSNITDAQDVCADSSLSLGYYLVWPDGTLNPDSGGVFNGASFRYLQDVTTLEVSTNRDIYHHSFVNGWFPVPNSVLTYTTDAAKGTFDNLYVGHLEVTTNSSALFTSGMHILNYDVANPANDGQDEHDTMDSGLFVVTEGSTANSTNNLIVDKFAAMYYDASSNQWRITKGTNGGAEVDGDEATWISASNSAAQFANHSNGRPTSGLRGTRIKDQGSSERILTESDISNFITASSVSSNYATASSLTSLTNTVNGLPTSISELGDVSVVAASLSNGQYLKWENTEWVAGSAGDFTTGVTSINGTLTGAVTLTSDNITEGSSNLYYADSHVESYVTASTTTGIATKSYVDTQVASLVDSAPEALDTLAELATALGSDASFSTTVTNNIATKAPLSTEIGAGTGIVTAGSLGSGVTVSLGTVTSDVGTFGSANKVPQITVDTYGRVTAATLVDVHNFSGSYIDLTDKPNDIVTTGVLADELATKQDALVLSAALTFSGATLTTAFDIDDYLTENDAASTYATASSLTDLATTVSGKQDSFAVGTGLTLSGGTLSATVSLDGLATQQYVTDNTADFITSSSVSTNYALKSEITDFITASSVSGNYALQSDISDFITASSVSSNYALQSDISDFITASSVSGNYALQSDLTNKQNAFTVGDGLELTSAGTLTTSFNISDYATASSLTELTTTVNGKQDSFAVGTGLTLSGGTLSATVDLSGHITASSVSTNYALKSEITDFITASSVSGNYALQSTLASTKIIDLADVNISAGSLTNGEYLKWNNTEWVRGSTSDFMTGVTSLTGGTGIDVTAATGAITVSVDNTIATAASLNALSTTVSGKQDSFALGAGLTLSGGTLSATVSTLDGYATEDYVATQVGNIINTAPTLLNTLDELAAALNDDANFATTVTDLIGTKQDALTAGDNVSITGSTISVNLSSYATAATIASTYLTQANAATTYATATSTAGSITALGQRIDGVEDFTVSIAGNPISINGGTLAAATLSASLSNAMAEDLSISSLATAASLSAVKATVDARVNVTNVGTGLTLSGGTLSATVDLGGYITAASISDTYLTQDTASTTYATATSTASSITALGGRIDDVEDFTVSIAGSTISINGGIIAASTLSASLTDAMREDLSIDSLATAASLNAVEAKVDERITVTATGTGLSLSGGTLSTTVDLSTLATAATLSNYVLTSAGNTAYASATATAGSITALSGRLDDIEEDYLTSGSTLTGANVSGNIAGQAGSVDSLSGHSISLAGNTISLAGGTITAASLSDSLKTEMSTDLGISSLATGASLTAVSGRVTEIENDYLTSATTLSSAKLNNSGVTLAGLGVDLGGAITAASLSQALSSDMSSDLNISSLATAASLSSVSGRVTEIENDYLTSATTLSSAKLDNSSVSLGGLSVSLGGSITAASLSDALKTEMSTDLGISTLATAASLTGGLATKQGTLTVATGSKISLSQEDELDVDLSLYALSADYTTSASLTNLLDAKQDNVSAGSNISITGSTIAVASSLSNAVSANTDKVGFTNALARGAISATGDLSYTENTGVVSYTSQWTTSSGKITTDNVVLVPGHVVEVFDMGADLTNQPDFTLDAGTIAGSVDRVVDCGILDQRRLF